MSDHVCDQSCRVGKAFAWGFWVGVVCGGLLVAQLPQFVALLRGTP